MVDIHKDVVMVVVVTPIEAEVDIVMIQEAGRAMENRDTVMAAREDAITMAKEKVVTCEIATIINYNASIELKLPTKARQVFYFTLEGIDNMSESDAKA
jgi:hypothetical protein